jgi:hypothetical protein
MSINREWLGTEFPTESPADAPGLFTRTGPQGEILSFGHRGDYETTEVFPAELRATVMRATTWEGDSEEGSPDEPEEWLATWRENVLAEARPKLTTPSCSFCGKTNQEVRKLIAGPSCYICDECIALCNDIVQEDHHLDPAVADEYT